MKGSTLATLRRDRGVSQTDVAAAAGISRQGVNSLEHQGFVNPAAALRYLRALFPNSDVEIEIEAFVDDASVSKERLP